MKSLFKKFRLFVAALLVGAAVFGLAGCTPPNSGHDAEPTVVYTEAVYKAEAGDWYKVFYEDGKPVKIYTCSVSYDASWNATRTISVETAKEKTYDELVVLDANGHYGTFEAVDGGFPTPTGGKMLLLKASSHTNYSAGCCYGNSTIGTEKHADCYIPCVFELSADGNTLKFMEYYNTSLKNDGASGTACFASKDTAIENLPYAKSGYQDTVYTKQ